ncbi:MAG: DUF302 domain-containing protein [Campylobacterales bacterium]|nr:DUF302 domain-containing protein [Campylobacterales bacterium]
MQNIKIVVFSAISLFLGAVLTAIFIQFSAKNMLLLEVKSPYEFEKSVEVVENRIKNKPNWKIVSTIDQNEEIVKGGEKGIGKVKIIKYCNAKFAKQMLSSDDRLKMAVSMPISLAIYEKSNGEVYISMSNGYLMSKLYGGEIEKIIEEVSLDVEDILSFMNFKFSRF